jgi:hypothetical protein
VCATRIAVGNSRLADANLNPGAQRALAIDQATTTSLE